MNLQDAINKHRKDIKTEKMDMSFGEIINMYKEGEIIISPEYQRSFRWDKKRQTDFIESILLGIPFPSIFVAANPDGKWELVDGLQRVSTILAFFGELKENENETKKNNLVLLEGSIIKQLKDHTVISLPLDLKLAIKRTPCRVEVIQKESGFEMRYELFKRLNTGGEGLSRQEIRNCVYRGLENYKSFSDCIIEASRYNNFIKIVSISDTLIEQMYYEELFLRFFSLLNFRSSYVENSIQDFFDKIMMNMSISPDIDLISNTKLKFYKIVDYIEKNEENVFSLSRLNFSTSMYDAIMLTVAEEELYDKITPQQLIERVELLKSSVEFKRYAGSASSSKTNIENKLVVAKKVFISEKYDANN